MSAPSEAHEHRVELLEQLADLAGLRDPFGLGAGLIPDVSRVDNRCRRLLVGDAKNTETPGCEATGRRLRRYVVPLSGHLRSGVEARLVLAVPLHGTDACMWLRMLLRTVAPLPVTEFGHLDVDYTTTLVWVHLQATPPRSVDRGQAFRAGTAGCLDERRLVD